MPDKASVADTRARILEAALAAFTERGYEGATTREVAQRAGVAELTIFRHFGTKGNLLRCALAPAAFLPAHPQGKQDAAALPKEFFDKLAQRLWEGMMGPRRKLLQVMVGEATRRPELHESMGQMPRQFAEGIGSYLAALQKRGAVRSGDPRLMSLAFLGMFFAVAVGGEYFQPAGDEFTPEETIQTYVQIFLHGVLADKQQI